MRSLKPSPVILLLLTHLAIGCSGGSSETEKHKNAGPELEDQGRSTDAIQDLDEVIKLDPLLADAYVKRDFAYSELGQYQEATQVYNEAIRVSPQLAPGLSQPRWRL